MCEGVVSTDHDLEPSFGFVHADLTSVRVRRVPGYSTGVDLGMTVAYSRIPKYQQGHDRLRLDVKSAEEIKHSRKAGSWWRLAVLICHKIACGID